MLSSMQGPHVPNPTPFQVLKDLPKKTERIEWCEMTTMQRTIYREALQRSRKTVQVLGDESQSAPEVKTKGKAKGRSKLGAMSGDTSSNVLMDLRKAASHPMLFRRLFDDAKIQVMARHCLREPEFCESNYNYVVEDMEVMTDAELQYFCKKYKVSWSVPSSAKYHLTPLWLSLSTNTPLTTIAISRLARSRN